MEHICFTCAPCAIDYVLFIYYKEMAVGHDAQIRKRKQVSLAKKWHTIGFEKEEEMSRPEYKRRVKSLKRN